MKRRDKGGGSQAVQEEDEQSVQDDRRRMCSLCRMCRMGALAPGRAECAWCSWWDWTHRFPRDSLPCVFDLLYWRRASIGVSGMLSELLWLCLQVGLESGGFTLGCWGCLTCPSPFQK